MVSMSDPQKIRSHGYMASNAVQKMIRLMKSDEDDDERKGREC